MNIVPLLQKLLTLFLHHLFCSFKVFWFQRAILHHGSVKQVEFRLAVRTAHMYVWWQVLVGEEKEPQTEIEKYCGHIVAFIVSATKVGNKIISSKCFGKIHATKDKVVENTSRINFA